MTIPGAPQKRECGIAIPDKCVEFCYLVIFVKRLRIRFLRLPDNELNHSAVPVRRRAEFLLNVLGIQHSRQPAFPNITGAFKKLKAIESSPWFDTTVFSQPKAGTQGDVGNYVYAGPRFFNLNASIFRNIRIT